MKDNNAIVEELKNIITLLEKDEPDYTKITHELGKPFLSCCIRDESTANAIASMGAVVRSYCQVTGAPLNFICCVFMDEDTKEEGESSND